MSPSTFEGSQVLEGPPDKVVALASIIEKDARHCDFRVVRQVYTENRQYPNFGMMNGGTFDTTRPEDEDPFIWAKLPAQKRAAELLAKKEAEKAEKAEKAAELLAKKGVEKAEKAEKAAELLAKKDTEKAEKAEKAA